MHVHLYQRQLADVERPSPEHGHRPSPKHRGFSLQLVVDDIDFWWERAVKAGVEVVMPVERMFWGDRYGQLRPPSASPGR